jgi:DNA primase
MAKASVPLEKLTHTGLRRMLAEMYDLHAGNVTPDLDALRVRLIDRPDLAKAAADQLEVGRGMRERPELLTRIVKAFDELVDESEKRAIKEALAGGADDTAALDLLRRLQGEKK